MILTLDIGNSHIFAGVLERDKVLLTFRKDSTTPTTSDELGVFIKNVLRENSVSADKIKAISMCSVVPALTYTVKNACMKYFGKEPFVLGPGVKTGLNIKYKNTSEVGSDRIANAIAATHIYPQKNVIVIDFGTATTFCAITDKKDYLGGSILPGIKCSMESLSEKAAKLFSVEIAKPKNLIGQTTAESIQSGIYYGNLAIIQSFCNRIKTDYFKEKDCVVIATGGFSKLFKDENIFDLIIPDLVLKGLYLAYNHNQKEN
jgi:type III pantothenate kinase